MIQLRTDVLVVGGGLGGVAAALAVARRGRSVLLTEEGDWLGGQLTAQAVPPDEHPWIERTGCTRSYRVLRERIRDYYRTWYPLTGQARAARWLNPGAGYVSGLCHEPRVALAVIDGLLAPHRSAARLRVLTHHRPLAAQTDGDRVAGVTLAGADGPGAAITAGYILDATETGELLALAGAEYVTGSESQAATGEPHASAAHRPLNMQAISVCFALDHLAGQDHTIDRPAGYDAWRGYRPPHWPGPLLGWSAPDPRTHRPVARTLVPNPPGDPATARPGAPGGDRELWQFRRIAARANFAPGAYASDITLVNWPMIDYTVGPVVDVPAVDAARHLAAARQLSLSLLYWLQTEAPRPDGGDGYPGLRLRGDVCDGPDGLAKQAYIRESRRIVAEYTVVEQDLAVAARGQRGAVAYPDTVGVGSYRIDLHPSTGGDAYLDIPAHPFQLPLGALLPVRVDNLLPAAKNIGTTHITNGCYRLHPVEWNVGEVAGLLAGFCLDHRLVPRQVRADPEHLAAFQALLDREGVQRRWPADVLAQAAAGHPD